jgi:hypothetical protein
MNTKCVIRVERHSQRKNKTLKPISTAKLGTQKIINTVAAMVVELGIVVTYKKAVGKVKLKISGIEKPVHIL